MASSFHYFSLEHFPFDICKEVATAIKLFYPIGIDPLQQEYSEYPGIIKLGNVISENIVDAKVYKKRWSGFLTKLRKDFGKNRDFLFGTTGADAGYSAELILDKYEDEVMIREKKIVFAVSLIGSFYSVCGVDETVVLDRDERIKYYSAINAITASPYKEFEKAFILLQKRIEATFQDYQFVPIRTALQMVKGLYSTSGEDGTVYEALFNHHFNYYYAPLKLYRGDQFYGYGEPSSKRNITLTAPPPL